MGTALTAVFKRDGPRFSTMLNFKHRDGIAPNVLIISYIFLAWFFSLYLLIQGFAWLPAMLLLAHSLVIAAYMLHECAHNTVFASPKDNERLGIILSWLTGACYLPYRHIRNKHFRHHVQREDVLAINAHELLQKHPVQLRIVKSLSWLCIPAFDLYTHILCMAAPFMLEDIRHWRARVVTVLVIRTAAFFLLYLLSPMAVLAYLCAYTIMVAVLHFMDAFQHDYRIVYTLTSGARKPSEGIDYENTHTFTNPLSMRFPVLNLLVLNFCYHNIHHQKPNEPWYRLPKLHKQVYSQDFEQQLSFREQIKRFFKYRQHRIESIGNKETGTDGVSFLVGV